jgi:NAD(P)-dependent dehydrogenase (short-subunit alcohol dehydrogenase family)
MSETTGATRSPDDRLRLTGRTVVVAGGGGGGIGTSVCRMAAEVGASIAAFDVAAERLDALEAALAHTAGPHRMFQVDLRDADAVEAAMDRVVAEGPPLWGQVQVAGGLYSEQWGAIATLDLRHFDAVFDLNLRAAVIGTRAAARRMAAAGTGGSIVTISSAAGLAGMPYGVAYSASKAALMAYTKTAAIEWGPAGIRVNSVAPGSVRTPKNQAVSVPAPDTPAEKAAIPLGRRGHPDDIAGTVVFLLSDLSGWTSGQILAVDGGNTARPSFLDDEQLPVFVHDPIVRALMRGGTE